MDVNVEKTGSYGRKLSVTLPVDEVNKAFDRAYKAIAKNARIPGFRPGKAPRSVIEMHYGPQLRSEVEQSLVSSSLLQALQQSEETPVAMPAVDPGTLKRGAEFSYTAEFEVPPEVKVEKYEGLAIERLEVEVAESDVEHELEQMREHAAQLVPVMVREETQKGDIVTMDYEGFIENEPFPGGSGENAMIELGGSDYLPGFSEGIEGAKVGATVSFPVTFPEEYGGQDLAGKTATFKVTVKEIKTRELPALDDDFAKDVGEDSLDALKTKVREQLESRKKREVEEEQRTLVMKALVEANDFEVPPTMIRQQAERMVRNAAERMQQIMGPQFQLNGEQFQALLQDNEKDAEFQVRSGLLLLEVSKEASIEVGDDEIQEEIDRIAEEAGDQGERVRAHYADPEQRDRLRFRLIEDKTVALILDKSIPAPKSENPGKDED